MGSYMSKTDDFQIIENGELNEDYISPQDKLIIYVVRKTQLLNQLGSYFLNADPNSIYYKYIMGTIEHESIGINNYKYRITSNMFYNIYRYEFYDSIKYNIFYDL
jgi:hypothetical protein